MDGLDCLSGWKADPDLWELDLAWRGECRMNWMFNKHLTETVIQTYTVWKSQSQTGQFHLTHPYFHFHLFYLYFERKNTKHQKKACFFSGFFTNLSFLNNMFFCRLWLFLKLVRVTSPSLFLFLPRPKHHLDELPYHQSHNNIDAFFQWNT